MDSYEARWYILHMGYFVSAIISFVVGIMVGYLLTGSHEYAVRSLQKQLRISVCPHRIDDSVRYYTVHMIVGQGNFYCRLLRLLHIPIRLVVSGVIRWIPSDDPKSEGFHSFVYPVRAGRRVLENIPNFYIIPNTRVELAVAKSELFDVYALGGFGQGIAFRGDYDLHIDLFDQENNQLPRLTIKNYIQDGKVNL